MSEDTKRAEAENVANKRATRRKLLTGAAAGLVVGAVAGAGIGSLGFPRTVTQVQTETSTTTSVSEPWIPTTWDKVADVVVVGYGGAGAVTALSAQAAGADVLVLEKTPSLASLAVPGANISGGGGNTHINGGLIVVPNDANLGATQAYYLGWGTTPMAVCQAWSDLANKIPSYLDNLGLTYNTATGTAELPNFPGASSITTATVNGGGASLFHALDQAVQKNKINVLFGTAATELIQDPITKEVLGVAGLTYPTPSALTSVWSEPTGGTKINIKANRAVVLCTGGFEYDDEMKASFLKTYPVHFYGWIYNTGDGVKMASRAGAGLWHLNMFSGRCVPWFPDNDMAYGYFINTSNPMIIVDKRGKRYANESSPAAGHNWWVLLDDFDISVPEYTRVPSFLVFDETFRTKNGPISSYGGVALPSQLGGLSWSTDNSAEIAKGFIQQGSTPAALAAAINQTKFVGWNADDSVQVPSGINVNIDPNVLTATITNYNSYCAAGKDPDFGRNPSTMHPLQTPPFYALPLWPGGPNSQGGPIRNEKGQVLDTNGNPIPRLYSAGELGSIWGLYPTGGGNNSELIVFGQISGKNAAAETPQA
jgi:succinate dehydrogenase/fumarate reductase flavoprotein subunit